MGNSAQGQNELRRRSQENIPSPQQQIPPSTPSPQQPNRVPPPNNGEAARGNASFTGVPGQQKPPNQFISDLGLNNRGINPNLRVLPPQQQPNKNRVPPSRMNTLRY